MGFAVLCSRAVAYAVRERRFQAIKVGPHHVHSFIGDEPGEMLAHSLAHHASLAVIHTEAFFHEDGGHVEREAVYVTFELAHTRKGQVVGVSGVFCTNGVG